MAIDPITPGMTAQAVHPKSDAERARSDDRSKHDREDRRQHDEPREKTHPVPNNEGQITGKLIDTTA